jgi:hypothetical protein
MSIQGFWRLPCELTVLSPESQHGDGHWRDRGRPRPFLAGMVFAVLDIDVLCRNIEVLCQQPPGDFSTARFAAPSRAPPSAPFRYGCAADIQTYLAQPRVDGAKSLATFHVVRCGNVRFARRCTSRPRCSTTMGFRGSRVQIPPSR